MIAKGEPMARNHKKPTKPKKAETKGQDKRQALKWLEQRAEKAAKRAAELRKEIRHGDGPDGRMMPAEGSRWRKHPAFLAEFERDRVWTYLFFVWAEPPMSGQQAAVLETEIEEGKPHRRALPLSDFFVEFIEA